MRFELLATEPVRVSNGDGPLNGRLMSPYVWAQDGAFSMLLRRIEKGSPLTGTIMLAHGDGLQFQTLASSVIAPEPGGLDAKGCEDPTRVAVKGGCIVYYTGVREDGVAQLLWARGEDEARLEKRGVAHSSKVSENNTKEASVLRHSQGWCLLFEYSRDGRSRIGRGEASGPAGPWRESGDPIVVRAGSWDDYHLSTGPLLADDAGPLVFYNGATRDAVWSIGWARLDETGACVVERCTGPLIAAPAQSGPQGRKISFAASALRRDDGEIWLYYTHDDRALRRARLRAVED